MESVLQLFKGMSSTRLIAITVAAAALFIGILFFSFSFSKPNFAVLYSNLDLKESSDIINLLDANGTKYELRANGTQILVPDSMVLKLRMEMAQKGLPSKASIVGYEIFDDSDGLGTSSFVQNVNLVRALEGEIARTISSFRTIESARVHLVLPKRELFSRDKQQPSASVMVKLKGNNTLTRDEVNAIGHLVATAVPGLELSKITIVDAKGIPFKLGALNNDDPAHAMSNSEDYRVNFENRLRSTIEEILERTLGIGHVKANVSAEINFDRIVTNSEIYDPDGQVARSVQNSQETSNANDKSQDANASVAGNIPNAGGGGAGSQSTSNVTKTDELTNFEISKTIKNQISESGTIKRLSIAVLVDGIYNIDKKTNEVTYVPRSNEELKKIESLVKSTVGFDESRKDSVEVINMQFQTDLDSIKGESLQDWFKREFTSIVQTLVIGIVVILVILLVIRPVAIRAFELTKGEVSDLQSFDEIVSSLSTSDVSASQADQQEKLIDIDLIDERKKSSYINSVNNIVDKYPQETIAVLRKWISE
jgi:flagellar M-ring protein FliF